MLLTKGDTMFVLMVSSSPVQICVGSFFFAKILTHLCSSACRSRLCYSLGMLGAIIPVSSLVQLWACISLTDHG